MFLLRGFVMRGGSSVQRVGLDKVRLLCYVKNVPSNRTRTGEVEELAQGTGSGKSAVMSSGRGTGKGEVTWGVFI